MAWEPILLRISVHGPVLARQQLRGEVWDFEVGDPATMVVLEVEGPRIQILRSGAPSSEVSLTGRIREEATGLLRDGRGNVYVAATRRRGLVYRLDVDRTELEPFADWDWNGGPVCMDPASRLFFPGFDEATGERSWASYDAATHKLDSHRCPQSFYDFIINPIGVCADDRAFAASGTTVRRFTESCEVDWEEQIDNIVDAGEEGIWTSSLQSNSGTPVVRLRRWLKGDSPEADIMVPLPAELASDGSWRLTSLDEGGWFVLTSSSAVSSEVKALVISEDGKLVATKELRREYFREEFRLQPPNSWAVSEEGRLYLPLLGPHAFHLVELTPSS